MSESILAGSSQKRLQAAAGNWAFVNEEGNLSWEVEGKEPTTLWSILSPTLLLGHPQQNAIMPTQYIKISDVEKVSLGRDIGIVLSVRGKGTARLRCPPEDFGKWSTSIQRAVRGMTQRQSTDSNSQTPGEYVKGVRENLDRGAELRALGKAAAQSSLDLQKPAVIEYDTESTTRAESIYSHQSIAQTADSSITRQKSVSPPRSPTPQLLISEEENRRRDEEQRRREEERIRNEERLRREQGELQEEIKQQRDRMKAESERLEHEWAEEREREEQLVSQARERRQEDEERRRRLAEEDVQRAKLLREQEEQRQQDASELRQRMEDEIIRQKDNLSSQEDDMKQRRQAAEEEARMWDERRKEEEEWLRESYKKRAEDRQRWEREKRLAKEEERQWEEERRNERRKQDVLRKEREEEDDKWRKDLEEEMRRCEEKRKVEADLRREAERKRMEEETQVIKEEETRRNIKIEEVHRRGEEMRRKAEDDTRRRAAEEAARRATTMAEQLQQALHKAEAMKAQKTCPRERSTSQPPVHNRDLPTPIAVNMFPPSIQRDNVTPSIHPSLIPMHNSVPQNVIRHISPVLQQTVTFDKLRGSRSVSPANKNDIEILMSPLRNNNFPGRQSPPPPRKIIPSEMEFGHVAVAEGRNTEKSPFIKVSAPQPFSHVSGVYEIQEDRVNGWPSWKYGSKRLYATSHGYWAIVDNEHDMTKDAGLLQSSAPHYGRSPSRVPWDSVKDGMWKQDSRVVVSEASSASPRRSPPARSPFVIPVPQPISATASSIHQVVPTDNVTNSSILESAFGGPPPISHLSKVAFPQPSPPPPEFVSEPPRPQKSELEQVRRSLASPPPPPPPEPAFSKISPPRTAYVDVRNPPDRNGVPLKPMYVSYIPKITSTTGLETMDCSITPISESNLPRQRKLMEVPKSNYPLLGEMEAAGPSWMETGVSYARTSRPPSPAPLMQSFAEAAPQNGIGAPLRSSSVPLHKTVAERSRRSSQISLSTYDSNENGNPNVMRVRGRPLDRRDPDSPISLSTYKSEPIGGAVWNDPHRSTPLGNVTNTAASRSTKRTRTPPGVRTPRGAISTPLGSPSQPANIPRNGFSIFTPQGKPQPAATSSLVSDTPPGQNKRRYDKLTVEKAENSLKKGMEVRRHSVSSGQVLDRYDPYFIL